MLPGWASSPASGKWEYASPVRRSHLATVVAGHGASQGGAVSGRWGWSSGMNGWQGLIGSLAEADMALGLTRVVVGRDSGMRGCS